MRPLTPDEAAAVAAAVVYVHGCCPAYLVPPHHFASGRFVSPAWRVHVGGWAALPLYETPGEASAAALSCRTALAHALQAATARFARPDDRPVVVTHHEAGA